MTALSNDTPRTYRTLGLLLALALGSGAIVVGRGAPLARKTWDFRADEPGKTPGGFTAAVGRWEVAEDGGNRVLAQKARNDDATFNVVLAEGTNYRDLDLSVRMRAVAGETDRGGGLVWRARDARNYYVCRYNPLEDNFRVYKVEAGKRTQFRSAMVPGDSAWHTIRATMVGNKITCRLDGQAMLEVEDSTFPGAGMIGLWSKADAQSFFDDLSVEEAPR
jgi:hypothetical protein